MNLKQARELRIGDEVYWNDPDDDICSRYYNIAKIEILGNDIVHLVDKDGSELSCFISELE